MCTCGHEQAVHRHLGMGSCTTCSCRGFTPGRQLHSDPPSDARARAMSDRQQLPDGFRQIAPNVVVSAEQVLVFGIPAEPETANGGGLSDHNCDAMGCGSGEHVIFRARLQP
jgi:hypothetical protein